MKELVLNQEAVELIAEALRADIEFWNSHNKVLEMHGSDEKVQKHISKNNEHIAKVKTILDYIEA